MINKTFLRKAYLLNLSAIAVTLSLSVWMLTFFIISLVIVWILDGGPARITTSSGNKWAIFIYTGTFLVFLIWMFNTSNSLYGLRELEQKLPLLIIPFIISFSQPLDENELKGVLSFFISGVIISSCAGLISYSAGNIKAQDLRTISIFIPYMQLAEMTDLAIVFSIYYFVTESSGNSRYLYLASALWLTGFLFILFSITGLLILSVLTVIGLYLVISVKGYSLIKTGFVFLVILLIVFMAVFVRHEVKAFYNINRIPLKSTTINGNPYQNYPERKDIENGNPVWINICETELRKEWNKRSSFSYDSADLRYQKLKYTLIRYIASKGYDKDSSGIAQLTPDDIKYIERGVTNVLFTRGKPIRSKIYELVWQIDYYRNGGNPSGHSVTQRVEFLKTGWNCFRNNLITGSGTGDFVDEMKAQYRKNRSMLDENYWYLPHNQYLTFLTSFGIAGFLIIAFCLIVPIKILKSLKDIRFILFLLIILLSMLGEDTLETHTGVTFFAYFYGLFVFGKNKIK
jgi:hypothetical protein